MSQPQFTWQLTREALDAVSAQRRDYLTRLAAYLATRHNGDSSATRQQLAHKLPDISDITDDTELAAALKQVVGDSVVEPLTKAFIAELNDALSQVDMTDLSVERMEEIALEAERPGAVSSSFYDLLKDSVNGDGSHEPRIESAALRSQTIQDLYEQIAAKLVREIELQSFRSMPNRHFVDLTAGSLPELDLDMAREDYAETIEAAE